jgi:hypothetical protein
MKALRLIILGALLALPMSVQAQDDPKPEAPAAASELDTNKDGKVDAKETAAATEADAGVGDVIAEGADVVKAAKALADKDESMPVGTMILVLLGAIFKLLLSLMKVLGKNIAWFKSKDGKRVIKYSTIGLGAAAALVANLGFGMHWIEAAQLVLSGPLAVAIHEYTKDSKDTPEEATADA